MVDGTMDDDAMGKNVIKGGFGVYINIKLYFLPEYNYGL
jgi:hypothetical protein